MHTTERPPDRPWAPIQRRRPHASWRAVLAAVLLAAGVLATVLAPSAVNARPTGPAMPTIDDEPWEPPPTTEPEPEPEPEPEEDPRPRPTPSPRPQCDDAEGFARPTGSVPPGYVYAPTLFDGPVAERQEDDTFAADAPGHAVHVGALRTRVVDGQEQMLVCAHVGTNTPDDILSAFPKPAPSPHAATISPRVVLIDALGNETVHDYGAPGTGSTLSHYRGSTDFREGYAQMWVPFSASLTEPGFVVRVEIRGTSALWGGRAVVMGADEVYVHLGPPPLYKGTSTPESFGLAVHESAIGERPTDPGPDDLTALVAPSVKKAVKAKLATYAGTAIEPEVDWDHDPLAYVKVYNGLVRTVGADIDQLEIDVEDFNESEGRFRVHVGGKAYPQFKIEPRTAGLTPITGGSCEVYTTLAADVNAGFVARLADDGKRLELDLTFLLVDATVEKVDARGTLTIAWVKDYDCSNINDRIRGGIEGKVESMLDSLKADDGVEKEIEKAIAGALAPADLAKGPLSNASAELPNGIGFRLLSPRYLKTSPPNAAGGDITVRDSGVHLAASATVYDEGGTRFPYSAVPTSDRTVIGSTSIASGRKDLTMVINGGTVNQLARALTAGEARPLTTTPGPALPTGLGPDLGSVEVGLLDLQPTVDGVKVEISPAVPLMYLPTPPTGWPVPGPVNVLVPSLRLRVPGIGSYAADVRAGANAGIDGTNHLVPEIRASKIDLSARWLRFEGKNLAVDPAHDPTGLTEYVRSRIDGAVPDAIGAMLRPVRLPDLSVGDGPKVHVGDLTIETVGRGHLALLAELEPGAGPSPQLLKTSFTPGPSGAPTHLTTEVLDPLVPLPGDPAPTKVSWTIKNLRGGAVVYQSPPAGDTTLAKTIPTTGMVADRDECTGEERFQLIVTAVVSKDGVRKEASIGTATKWQGPAPAEVPDHCFPEPVPEPEEPPIPPMCRAKPWLCEGQP